MKKTRVSTEEDQKSLGRYSLLIENYGSLTETVRQLKEKNERLADRFERLESSVQKISATEGKTYRVNSLLHLKICTKEQQI